jgi:uncharacterized membrane protein
MTAASEIYRILWYFAVYSVLGWCVEVVYCTVKTGKVANRGFLNGPVCPVYGFGMLAICRVVDLLPLERMGQIRFIPLFLAGMVLASLVELIAGWSLFHLFHTRWWDYSDRPFNIGGYVCLQMSLLWGTGTLIMIDFIHPITQRLTVDTVPMRVGWAVLAAFYMVFAADLAVTVSIMVGLNKRLAQLDELRASMRTVSDSMSGVLGKVHCRRSKKWTRTGCRRRLPGRSCGTSRRSEQKNSRARHRSGGENGRNTGEIWKNASTGSLLPEKCSGQGVFCGRFRIPNT